MSLKLSTLAALLLAVAAHADSSVEAVRDNNSTTLTITGDAAQELYQGMVQPDSVETAANRGFELTIKRSANLTCNELLLLSIAGTDRGEIETIKYECTLVISQ